MKATRMTASLAAVAALALTLAPVGSADAQQIKQSKQNWLFGTEHYVTGTWNFDDSGNRYAADCGQNGSVWIRDFTPIRDIREETLFGLASSFGIPDMPDGDGGVMRFPDNDFAMGYKMFPGIEANGGGSSVNQYTLIFDVLYPQSSNRSWRSFYQTNDCNLNDGDLFVNTSNGIGISGVYDGTIRANRWHRVVFAFDLVGVGGDPESKSQFGTATELGASLFPDGQDGGVIKFSDFQGNEAIDMLHGIPANGGGDFVNNYTVIYDVYINTIPDWGAFWNTTNCNGNNAEFYVDADGFFGAWGSNLGWGAVDAGPLVPGTWYRIAVTVSGENDQLIKYIDGAPSGTVSDTLGLDNFLALYTVDDKFFPGAMLFADDNGEALDAYVSSVQIRDFTMTPEEIAALGGATSTNIPGGDGVAGQWDFENPAAGLAATTGNDLVWFTGGRGCGGSGALDKYIDGTLVGSQTLGSGLDGRWALSTASEGFPTLLFADDNGDTNVGYASSVQIRDHMMTREDVAALGGVSAAGIPGGAGVTGQWDFEDFKNGLAATTGNDLDWFDAEGCFEPGCEQDLNATTEFGTTTSFGIPDLPDGPANVMHYDAAVPCTGYLFPHGALANGGGTRVNNYTIILDLYTNAEDWDNVPPGHDPTWFPVYQSALNNNEDAMFWFRKDRPGNCEFGAAMGDDGSYDFTEGWLCREEWKRIVIAVKGDEPTGTTITKYAIAVNGAVQGPVLQDEGAGELVDGKRSLWTREAVGVDHLLFFTNDWDDPFYTARGFVSSIQVRNYTMSTAEVEQLGGPRAAGIPIDVDCRPSECDPCDMDCDGDVDAFDIEPFLALLFNGGVPCDTCTGDTDGDGDIDAFDIEPFLSCLFP